MSLALTNPRTIAIMRLLPMSTPEARDRIHPIAKPVVAPLTSAAIFLVVTLRPGPDNPATIRTFCTDLAALLRAVEARDIAGGLTCVMGIGSDAWDILFGPPRPKNLHTFREI